MNLKKQVTSLKLSEELKKLEVPQKSLFVWYDPSSVGGPEAKLMLARYGPTRNLELYYSAFTVAELYQLHYEKFGTLDKIPVQVDPEELATYIARILCQRLGEE